MGKKASDHEHPEESSLVQDAFGSDEDEGGFNINRKYAVSFEQKKRKEDLHRARRLLEEEEEEEEDSESEDSEGALITPKVEKSFLELLPKIRAKSKDIYQKDKTFFPKYEEIVEEAKINRTADDKNEKAFRIKDYVRESILEKMNNDENDGSDSDQDPEPTGPTPHEELMQIKQKFAQKATESSSDDDDDLLILRSKSKTDQEEEDKEFEKWENAKKQDAKLNPKKLKSLNPQELLAHFWSADDNQDENENFLRKYIVTEGWMDRDRNRIPSYDEIIRDDDEDMNEIERQEAFEQKHNFRFEEPGGTELVSHPREIEDSVRRKNDKRKRKRDQRKQKKELEKTQKQEELKRLKNIKKQEIVERMAQIQKVTENQKIAMHGETLEKLLEGDYDPDQYDEQMNDLFSEDYYEDELGDNQKPFLDERKLEKPEFDDDDGFEEGGYDVEGDDYEMGEDYDDNFYPEAEKSKGFKEIRKKVQTTGGDEIVDKFVDEYYNLDYEDLIGDTPVRFGYQKVKADSFGLDIMEILEADPKELNSYVPLKHLAPYRRDEPRPRGKWNRKKNTNTRPKTTKPSKKKKKSSK